MSVFVLVQGHTKAVAAAKHAQLQCFAMQLDTFNCPTETRHGTQASPHSTRLTENSHDEPQGCLRKTMGVQKSIGGL